MGDRERWDHKHASSTIIQAPCSFIIQFFTEKKPASLLDFACGKGRHALYFAEQGYAVTATDISNVALTHIQQQAGEKQIPIKTILADLTNPQHIQSLGVFDYIIIAYYKPEIEILKTLPSILNPSGQLLLCSYNMKQHKTYQFNEKFCLPEAGYRHLSDDLTLIDHHEINEDQAFLDFYIFEKN